MDFVLRMAFPGRREPERKSSFSTGVWWKGEWGTGAANWEGEVAQACRPDVGIAQAGEVKHHRTLEWRRGETREAFTVQPSECHRLSPCSLKKSWIGEKQGCYSVLGGALSEIGHLKWMG